MRNMHRFIHISAEIKQETSGRIQQRVLSKRG
jgi:hypothetical protein